ncbi:MAG TPA: hypothetical protein VK806_09795 [Bacteroidia bacterium]|jgi:rRNA-processing protein FCF1|nr:hypothetical protein [Bacteroidia bacterium]
MALSSIIVDTTFFNYSIRFNSIDLNNILRNIISGGKVLVPSVILNEMEDFGNYYHQYANQIQYWIGQVQQNRFYSFCNSYDTLVYDTVRRYIDKGEADAIAQCEKTRVLHFITDDLDCIPYIKQHYSHIRINSTFFLIAIADIQGLIPNYEQTLLEYASILNYAAMTPATKRTHTRRLSTEYRQALQLLGNNYDEQLIYRKTGIATILRRNNP